MGARAFNLGKWRQEDSELVLGYVGELEANLGYRRSCLKEIIKYID